MTKPIKTVVIGYRISFPVAVALALCVVFAANSAGAQIVIDTDTTWTSSGSPYMITEDATVVEGVTLTIEQGVTVEFGSLGSMIVHGQLVARGNDLEPVTFTGAATGQDRERWGSVVFEDSSADAEYENLDDYISGSILEYCVFEYAARAVVLNGASPFIHRSTFRYNVYEYDGSPPGGPAICVFAGSAPRIVGCMFSDNEATQAAEGGAVYVEEAAPIIQDNTFVNNSSGYGGALVTHLVAFPIVGNSFEGNYAAWEGGGVAFVSSIPAFLNNIVTDNNCSMDGGGVHVCATCYPHATPFLMDNTITDNISDWHGGGGVGAAFIRVMSHNNIHDNETEERPADFAWFNRLDDGYPDPIQNPSVHSNWWGTTDRDFIAETIHDGNDEDHYGRVTFDPVRAAPVAEPETRVTITTTKIQYGDVADEPMPVFLTVYNPGAERQVRLAVMLQHGQTPPLFYRGDLDFPGAQAEDDGYLLTLPENSVYFTRLMEPLYGTVEGPQFGAWHAALFDAQTTERIGDVCTIHFYFGPGGGH
jgi:hypothetical protein